MDEDEGLDLSPSERLGVYLKSLKARLANRTQPQGAPPATPANTFWRELAVTVALLLVCGVATAIPVPVVKWHALASLRGGFGWAVGRFSITTLGLGPYIIAHWLVFWFVMAVPRLRHMGFRYRYSLNKYVLVFTFLLVVVQAWGIAAWYGGMISPRGERVLLPYFVHHPHALQAVATICLAAGMAFTLMIVALIQRYGIPCAVTCMMIWGAFASLSFFRQLGREFRFGVANDLSIIGGSHRAAWWFRSGLLWLGAAFLILFATVVLIRRLRAFPTVGRLVDGIQKRWYGEPSPVMFSTLSTSLIISTFTVVLGLLALSGLFPILHLKISQRSFGIWRFEHVALYSLVAAAVALPSAFIAYRLLYNPALRHRLGAALGLDESLADLKAITRRSLLLWFGFAAFVILLAWPQRVLGDLDGLWSLVFSIHLWDVVLLILTVFLVRKFYRLRAEGLRCPVLSHGYYEPLYAARALLEENGIRSQIWGEPFAMLFGFIVGPIGLKHLLVSEEDLDSASELLREQMAGLTVD